MLGKFIEPIVFFFVVATPVVMLVAIFLLVQDKAKRFRFLLIFLGLIIGSSFGSWLDSDRFPKGRDIIAIEWIQIIAALVTGDDSSRYLMRFMRTLTGSFYHILGGGFIGGSAAFMLTGYKAIAELLIGGGADVKPKQLKSVVRSKRESVTKSNKEIISASILDSGTEKTTQPLPPPSKKPVSITSQQGTTTAKPSCTTTDSALLDAAKSNNTDLLKQHLDAGANVNASGKTLLGYSVTPLHEAASWGQKGNIELLIANGANVNAKDEVGKTPLDSATSETADLLRKHGGKTGEELEAEGK